MKTEVFIENQQVDITAELSSLLTFAIDDISDFASRQTTFSKTIVLPGTAKNNQVFGNIFQVGNSNSYDVSMPNVGYNFNASKSASCLIFQDNIQTFKGVIRILQINIDKGRIEYETSVFGDLFSLNVALTSARLEDLDFSEYDHTFNETAIVNSWDNAPGSGYYYPLIDYGNFSVNKHDWKFQTFRPGLYVKEYIDKMFDVAGFRYNSALFNTDRFKGLIIPHNQKTLTILRSDILKGLITASHTMIDTNHGDDSEKVPWDSVDTTSFTFVPNTSLVYIGADSITANLDIQLSGTRVSTGGTGSFSITVLKNGSPIFQQIFGLPPTVQGYRFNANITTPLVTSDFIEIRYDYISGTAVIVTLDDPSPSVHESYINISSDHPIYVPVGLGDTVTINTAVPKNVRQIDFLVSIIQLFNLYVYEDKFDSSLVNITPYVDFYSTDSTDSDDWTYKLNRDKVISLKPMSELTSKIYNFNYATDSDYYNDLYNKRYGQVYGSYIFDSEFEFADQTNALELIFAPTPLVGYAGEDKVYSTIQKVNNPDDPIKRTEESVDSVIRILQTKKLTGLTSWDILDGVTVLTSLTSYGYAGHFDDPDAPTNDLNFGALEELFYVLAAGDLSNTQFNIYWSTYMAEITDKDSKLLTGYFYLRPSDIFSLDFSRYKYVDGVLFRLNKITDYNMSSPGDCACELLKVINTIY